MVSGVFLAPDHHRQAPDSQHHRHRVSLLHGQFFLLIPRRPRLSVRERCAHRTWLLERDTAATSDIRLCRGVFSPIEGLKTFMHAHRSRKRRDRPSAPGAAVLTGARRTGRSHAFTTRVGGVSRGQFETLNFGNPGELRAMRIRQRTSPATSIWCSARSVRRAAAVQVHQVHGGCPRLDRVAIFRAGPDASDQADAIVTDDPGSMALVRVADRAPVLLSSVGGEVVVAVHAGWRGVVAGVLPAATDAMRGSGRRQKVLEVPAPPGRIPWTGSRSDPGRRAILPALGARTRLIRAGAPGRFHADLQGRFRAVQREDPERWGRRHAPRHARVRHPPGCTCGDGRGTSPTGRDGVRSSVYCVPGPWPRADFWLVSSLACGSRVPATSARAASPRRKRQRARAPAPAPVAAR